MKLKPYPFQEKGIKFLSEGGSLLAYDMGLGKSLTSLWAAGNYLMEGPILIACPSVVVGVWESEIPRLYPDASVLVLTSKNTYALSKNPDFVIVSIDLPGRTPPVKQALLQFQWGLLIVDEAHYLKELTSKRTQAWISGATAIAKKCYRVFLLTGTPVLNHAGDLYPLIQVTGWGLINRMSRYSFEEKYCTHKMVRLNKRDMRVISGTNRVKINDLRSRLDGWWLRERKSEVLTDLPPKRTRVIPVEVYNLDAQIEEFTESDEGRLLAQSIAMGRMPDLHEDASMSRFRKLLAMAKAEACADYAQHLVEGGEATLLWFWHTEAMNMAEARLTAAGIDLLRIDGSTSQTVRQSHVDRFQDPSGPRLMLLQIKAAGVGITLTKATREVFAEASWVPAENAQAEDRAYRIGQTNPVIVDYLAIKDSLDFALLSVVERKTRDWEELELGTKGKA